jgi:hypothetical protein
VSRLEARRRRFEAPKKPEPTERERALKKKREELARVQERLQAPDLRPGIARELRMRKHIVTLEREIVELGARPRNLCNTQVARS